MLSFSLAAALLAAAPPRSPATRPATRPAATRPAARSEAPGRNLVVNGDFEKPDASGRLPEGWTTKHPKNVRLADVGRPRGKAVEMTGDEALMGTYGTDLTGGKIDFKPNTRYRCTGWTRSEGPSLIVFVKGYATVTRRDKGRQVTQEDPVYQMRKEIAPNKEWTRFNLDFDVKPVSEYSDFQHKVEYLRITLWAYWPAGTCWYDDIRFEEVGPIPAGQRLHDDAVTHAGTKARLGPGSQPATGAGDAALDVEQTWLDAANAFRGGQDAQALALAEKLMARDGARADYVVLAARAAARLKRWDEAERYAGRLLERPAEGAALSVEPWQREWAQVVQGEVLMRTNRVEQGRPLLESVSKGASSPHAKAAADNLLSEFKQR